MTVAATASDMRAHGRRAIGRKESELEFFSFVPPAFLPEAFLTGSFLPGGLSFHSDVPLAKNKRPALAGLRFLVGGLGLLRAPCAPPLRGQHSQSRMLFKFASCKLVDLGILGSGS